MIDYKSTVDEIIASGTDTAIIPIGSTEQHGPHLPMCTDICTAEYIARGIAEKTGAYLLPTLPISTCYEHKGKKGSVWMRPTTFYNMLQDICLCLRDQGFKKIGVVLGHGGIFIANPAIRELNACYDDIKVARLDLTTYFTDPELSNILEFRGNLHACEFETSAMLYLMEDAVKKEKIAEADFVPDVPREYMNYQPLVKLSKTGVWGKPSLGTKEKGEKIMKLLVEKACADMEKAFELCTYEEW